MKIAPKKRRRSKRVVRKVSAPVCNCKVIPSNVNHRKKKELPDTRVGNRNIVRRLRKMHISDDMLKIVVRIAQKQEKKR